MSKHTRTKAWAMLMGAIGLEILGLNLLQVFHAHATLGKVLLLAFMNVSYFLMSLALRQISVGVAYATWEIVGGVGVLLTSFVFFAPNLSPQHYVGIAVGFTGIVCIILGEEHSDDIGTAKPLKLANTDLSGASRENLANLADKSVNLTRNSQNLPQNSVNFTKNSANFAAPKNSVNFSANLATRGVNLSKNSAQNSHKFSKNSPKNSTNLAENSAPKD